MIHIMMVIHLAIRMISIIALIIIVVIPIVISAPFFPVDVVIMAVDI
jgi:hypothetical protein